MSESSRTYNSPLREQRAAETRRRIVEGAIRLLAQGSSALTIPAVAKEAGVAVPTVYRYFATKEDLEEGVGQHVRALAGVAQKEQGRGLEALIARMHNAWRQTAELPPATMAVMLSSIGRELMKPPSNDRIDNARRVLDEDLQGVDAQDQDRIIKVLSALYSTPGHAAFARLGIHSDEAADLMEWLGRTLFAGLRRAPEPETGAAPRQPAEGG